MPNRIGNGAGKLVAAQTQMADARYLVKHVGQGPFETIVIQVKDFKIGQSHEFPGNGSNKLVAAQCDFLCQKTKSMWCVREPFSSVLPSLESIIAAPPFLVLQYLLKSVMLYNQYGRVPVNWLSSM